MYIANIRITHNEVPQEVLDRLSITRSQLSDFYNDLLSLPNVEGALVLQTCNRFEIYFTGKNEKPGISEVKKFMLDKYGADISKYMISASYVDTLRHLFQVVASIDSLMVGENQILAQVRESYEFAKDNQFTGRILDPIVQKSLFIGKRIRTETKISDGKVSISSAAVDLANKHTPLNGKNVMIVGTGNMATLLAEYLCGFDLNSLMVVGRSPDKVLNFCSEFEGKPLAIADLSDNLAKADIVFSATACPRVLLTADMVKTAVSTAHPMTLIDIAMPADIDPTAGNMDDTIYFNIDDLKEISVKNLALRQQEVEKAEVIIEAELARLTFKLENLHIEKFLSSINVYVESIRVKELEKAVAMMEGADPAMTGIMEDFSKSLAKKIMHNFIKEVKMTNGDSVDMDKFLSIFVGSQNMPGHPGGHPGDHPGQQSEGYPGQHLNKEREDVPKHPHEEIEE